MIQTELLDTTFLDQHGIPRSIKDALDEKDFWETKRDKLLVISHAGFEKIARLAGISLQYDVEESPTIQPSYKNELEHIVRVTIYRRAKHGETVIEDSFTATGTANRVNTSGVGRKYIRVMAEKRGFDTAIKKLLGLSGAIYSEAESSDFSEFEEQAFYVLNGSVEFENIATDINSLLNAPDVKTLNAAARAIKKKKQKGEYSFAQENTLKRIYADRFVILNKPF